jgi:hypothetical protein
MFSLVDFQGKYVEPDQSKRHLRRVNGTFAKPRANPRPNTSDHRTNSYKKRHRYQPAAIGSLVEAPAPSPSSM